MTTEAERALAGKSVDSETSEREMALCFKKAVFKLKYENHISGSQAKKLTVRKPKGKQKIVWDKSDSQIRLCGVRVSSIPNSKRAYHIEKLISAENKKCERCESG